MGKLNCNPIDLWYAIVFICECDYNVIKLNILYIVKMPSNVHLCSHCLILGTLEGFYVVFNFAKKNFLLLFGHGAVLQMYDVYLLSVICTG